MFEALLAAYSFYGEKGANWTDYWQALAVLASITAVIIHILFLMFARSLNVRELEVYSKSEILQAFATVVLAVFLITIVEGIQTYIVQSGTVYGEVKCQDSMKTSTEEKKLVQSMFNIIRCRTQEKASAIAEVQERVVNDNDLNFNRLNLMMSIFGMTFFRGDWVGDWYKQAEQARITNNLATSMLISLNAQNFLATYLQNTMLHFFLTVGVLLRAFHFTRGVGAFMISLAIGMYFIFPMMFILLDPGFVKLDLPKATGIKTSSAATMCYPTMSAAVAMVTNTPAASGTAAAVSAGNIRDQLATSYVSLIVHPLVALFLTLVFVRYLMTLLGGDTYELSRMVMKVI